MRILYVAMRYDYGDRSAGGSFEHWNFFHPLSQMGFDLLYFDFLTIMQRRGQQEMNRRLWEVARSERPDLMFVVLFQDQLDKGVVRRISEELETVTINWFCDDHWRFDNFSRFWAPCFNWVVTTARSAVAKYERIGYANVIKSQWAANHFQYRRLELPLIYDVTFVGRPHGDRREVIAELRRAGIDVRVWGEGWKQGRIDQEQMIRVFGQSRINLNLSQASSAGDSPPPSALGRRLATLPCPGPIRRLGKRVLGRMGVLSRLSGVADGSPRPEQIKGRNFEVPGCGGFLLSGLADDLDRYYCIGEEIVCFDSLSDLIERTRYYLAHEQQRQAIAKAGYRRTIAQHTWAHRFDEIFRSTGLESPPLEELIRGRSGGQVIEVG